MYTPLKNCFNMLFIGDKKRSADMLTIYFQDILFKKDKNEFIMVVTDNEDYWRCEVARLKYKMSHVIINNFSDDRFLNLYTSADSGIKILLIIDKPIDGLYSDPRARYIIANNKNHGITSIIMTDSISTLPYETRDSIDYIMLLDFCSVSIDEYYDEYFAFKPKRNLKYLFDKYAGDNFSALCIDVKNCDKNNKISSVFMI
jgi:hypothetical protein